MYPVNQSQAAFASKPIPTEFTRGPKNTVQRPQKRRPEGRLSALLLELPPQPARHPVNIRLFPRPFRTDRTAPAIIPTVVSPLAIKGIGLVIKHINPQLLIPMTVPARRRREAGRGTRHRLGRFDRDARFARGGRRRWRRSWLRRRHRCRGRLFRRPLDRTSA